MSTAILSRRKTGKTALLQRLYNLTVEKNMEVIPFYYEVKEGKKWAVDFCRDFYLTFIYQYMAFKTRNPSYVSLIEEDKQFPKAIEVARREGLDYLIGGLQAIESLVKEENVDHLWLLVREAPYTLATRRNESIVQIIDEFQYLNSEISRDKAGTQVIDDFAAGYMSTAEYKNAPLLVSGSWIGWLYNDLISMLPGRFRMNDLKNLPEDEALEMVFKYSELEEVPVTEETAYLLAQLSEGNPFYISAIFRSLFEEKDLASEQGLLNTLEFETLDHRAIIKATWMDYIRAALPRINDLHAKNIVIYLCQHKERQVSRQELRDKLALPMTDGQLEEKMQMLLRADIIVKGQSNFYYRAVQDNIFDKVFRGEYASDIQEFDLQSITHEYKRLFEQSQAKYFELLGKYNQAKGAFPEKGAFAEFMILKKLRTAYLHSEHFQSMLTNLPEGFEFVEYESVWSYHGTLVGKRDFQVDIFAYAVDATAIIGEVKNRANTPFSGDEAQQFIKKLQTLKELEQVTHAVGFVFSRNGFTRDALTLFQKYQIAYSDDERWLD